MAASSSRKAHRSAKRPHIDSHEESNNPLLDSSSSGSASDLDADDPRARVSPRWKIPPRWPPDNLDEAWPPRPTEHTRRAFDSLKHSLGDTVGTCPFCLQTLLESMSVEALVQATSHITGRHDLIDWPEFCIHCYTLFTIHGIHKIGTWLTQYCTIDGSTRAEMYIRARLALEPIPHHRIVPDLPEEIRDRPLAYLHGSCLDHPPYPHNPSRERRQVTPWHADARSIILTYHPAEQRRFAESVARRLSALDTDRIHQAGRLPDENFVFS